MPRSCRSSLTAMAPGAAVRMTEPARSGHSYCTWSHRLVLASSDHGAHIYRPVIPADQSGDRNVPTMAIQLGNLGAQNGNSLPTSIGRLAARRSRSRMAALWPQSSVVIWIKRSCGSALRNGDSRFAPDGGGHSTALPPSWCPFRAQVKECIHAPSVYSRRCARIHRIQAAQSIRYRLVARHLQWDWRHRIAA